VRRLRIGSLLLACVVVPAAILAGCGGGGGGGSVDVGPAAAVPADTPVYLDATVRPTAAAEADAKAAAGRIMDTSDPGGKIISLITKSSQKTEKPGETFNWDEDIDPWLGNRAAIFYDSLQSSDPTIVIESKNNNAALAAEREDTRDTGQTATYKGHNYDVIEGGNAFGAVGSFMVYGPVNGFEQAVDADQGDSLGDSDDFKDAIGSLPDDRLGTLYTVPKTLLAAIPAGEIDPNIQQLLEKSAGESLDRPVTGALTASADSIDVELEGANNGVETPESSLIGGVPSRSWLAIGAADLGEIVKQTLDRVKDSIPNFDQAVQQIETTTGSSLDQLTGSLGDAALYVEGTTVPNLTGALVVQSKDTDLTGRLLQQLQGLLQLGSTSVKSLHLSGGGSGFRINDPSVAPAPIEVAQQGDKIVVGYGAGSAERTLSPTQSLQSNPTYSAANGQVSDLGTDLFIDLPTYFQLADSSSARKDPDYRAARPYFDALGYLVSGSGTANDKTEVKVVLGLK
jgi:Protein of unknown function (DUF3352)